MQPSETGLDRRNREFFAISSPKQVCDVLMAASQLNFDRDANQLHKRRGTFLLLRKTGDLSATTGRLMRDITHFATSEQVTVRRVALSKAAQLAGAAFDAVSCGAILDV